MSDFRRLMSLVKSSKKQWTPDCWSDPQANCDGTKKQFVGTVLLVQNLLAMHANVAVKQASEHVLSPTNSKAFGSANVKLVSSLLD
jgi:hypothetical protein